MLDLCLTQREARQKIRRSHAARERQHAWKEQEWDKRRSRQVRPDWPGDAPGHLWMQFQQQVDTLIKCKYNFEIPSIHFLCLLTPALRVLGGFEILVLKWQNNTWFKKKRRRNIKTHCRTYYCWCKLPHSKQAVVGVLPHTVRLQSAQQASNVQ